MKRKVRKYVEGGYGDVSSEDYGMGSQEEMIERNIQENERRRMMEGPTQSAPIRSPEIAKSTNVEEFQEPGTAGFSRTAIKQPAKQSKPAPAKPAPAKPAAAKSPAPPAEKPMGRTAMGKTAEMEMAAIEAARKTKGKSELERLKNYDKPLERVAPELALIGGPALRGAKAAGKAVSQATKPRVEPRIPQEPQKALGMSPKKGELATTKSSDVARKSGEVATKSGDLATRGGALATRKPSAAQIESAKPRLPYEKNMGKARIETQVNKRRQLRRDSRDEDAIEMGMKSGGKVGSASRRADGIATKGKTRGRYI